MLRRVAIEGATVCLTLALAGCSVGMALSGEKEPNLSAIGLGSTRGEVELQLGSPVESVTNPDGTRVDLYEYQPGNEPSAGRAIGHGILDVLTIGLWEIAGTPMEAAQARKKRLKIVYDQNDKVLSINQAAPPLKEETDAEKEEEQ